MADNIRSILASYGIRDDSFIHTRLNAIEQFLKTKFDDNESKLMLDVLILEEIRKEHQNKLKLLGRLNDEKDN